jgi:hypothetical protein
MAEFAIVEDGPTAERLIFAPAAAIPRRGLMRTMSTPAMLGQQPGKLAALRGCLKRRAVCWLVIAVGLALTGCKAEEKFEEDPIKANLRQINKAYSAHLGYHGTPPQPDDLRQAVQDLHALDMGRPADEALISPRDKQPIVIIYGADSTTPGHAILAYEKRGAEGTRWVVTMRQDFKQLSNEEFAKAVFAKGHKPDPE